MFSFIGNRWLMYGGPIVIHRIICSIEYAQWLIESNRIKSEIGEYESKEFQGYVYLKKHN